MTQQTISVGSVANDGTGDPIRAAFIKANSNFTELYARPTGGSGSGTVSSGTTGTLAYYALSGTALSPLTLGTGLSISGSTLNATGGSGSGTVNTGTAGRLAGYTATGTAVSPITIGSGLSYNSGTSTLTATGGGTSGSPLIVSLYQNGITSDATNGVDYGAAAPAGSTGQEAAINTLLATAAAAAGTGGVRIIWDVSVALGGPIYLYSNMTIEAPNPGFGAIMRAATNCPMWRVKGMDAAVSSNTSTQSQKNFGKIDSTAFGTTTGSTAFQYRVFDPTSINASNIAILGGTWNGNSQAQTVAAGTGSATYGLLPLMSFWGVDGLTIKNVRLFTALSYVIHCANVRHVVIEDIDLDQIAITTFVNDGIHVNGPSTDIRIARVKSHTSDDHVAFNADDVGTGGNFTAGINLHCSGAITNARVNGLQIWNGRENVTSWGAVRILSQAARVDDIIINDVSGTTANWAFLLDVYLPGCLLSGTGNVGRVVYDNVSLDVAASGAVSNAVFLIGANADSVEIRNRTRNNVAAAAYTDIRVEPSCTVKALAVSGTWTQQAGATAAAPIVRVGGTVTELQFQGRVLRDSSLSLTTNPVLQVLTDSAFNGRSAGTGAVGAAFINADITNVTNMVDFQAGTIGTLILAGAHRNAGTGCPLAIASGATLTNYVYGNGAYPLAYAHANVAAKSGTGTVTNANDYAEAVSAFPLSFPGSASTAPTGNSALTAYSGSSVANFLVDGSGNLTFGSGSYIAGYFAAAGVVGDGVYDMTYKSGNTNRHGSLFVRSTVSLSAYYQIKFDTPNGACVTRNGTVVIPSLTIAGTDTSVGLKVVGNVITFRKNGADTASTYTDGSVLAAGYVGVGSTDGGASAPAISSISFS